MKVGGESVDASSFFNEIPRKREKKRLFSLVILPSLPRDFFSLPPLDSCLQEAADISSSSSSFSIKPILFRHDVSDLLLSDTEACYISAFLI